MRLSHFEIDQIKLVFQFYDPHSKIFLFGSRIDDQKKGGDIDLLVISELISQSDLLSIKVELHDKIGEQKIDILLADPRLKDSAFVRIAKRNAIQL